MYRILLLSTLFIASCHHFPNCTPGVGFIIAETEEGKALNGLEIHGECEL